MAICFVIEILPSGFSEQSSDTNNKNMRIAYEDANIQ